MNRQSLKNELNWIKKEIESLENLKYPNIEQKELLSSKLNKAEKIKWLLSSEDEKQAERLEWIAVSRAHGYSGIEELWITIKIYEKIRITKPYILLLNNGGMLDSLLFLCQKELDNIDETRIPPAKHVTKQEIEEGFRLFFEEVKLPEELSEETLHPEAEQKIEELYELFCKL